MVQRVSLILLRGLLAHGGSIRPAWPSVCVVSSRFGGDYRERARAMRRPAAQA